MFNRGARHLPVFGDDDDRERFLSLIEAANAEVSVHAYALMGNHYHLLVEAEVGQLAALMKFVGENYTRRFNRKYGFDGPLFRSRYRSKPITSVVYLRHAVRYIHRNPIEDGLGDWEYRWSSHRAYVGAEPPPPWLSLGLLNEFGGVGSYREFVQATDPVPAPSEPGPDRGAIRTATPAEVDFALGIASPDELAVIAVGGRGLRNDVRVAAALLTTEMTNWSSERLARRYGYSSAANLRTAATRARQRLGSDERFAAIVEDARQRLRLPDVAGVRHQM